MTRTVKSHIFAIVNATIENGSLKSEIIDRVTINGESNEIDAEKAVKKKQKNGEVKRGHIILETVEKVTYFMEDEFFFANSTPISGGVDEKTVTEIIEN